MVTNDSIQAECLSLVASLYGAITNAERFVACRAECETWLARQVAPDIQVASFLRLQIGRATEARSLAATSRSAIPTACAIVTIDDRGRVLAASPEAWALVGSGTPAEGPLRLPLALRAFVEDAAISPAVPRALRVPLDDGSTELAGIVLGVDRVRHAVGTLRVMTLLLCDVGASEPVVDRAQPPRAEVREFRRRDRARGAARPYTMALAAERPA